MNRIKIIPVLLVPVVFVLYSPRKKKYNDLPPEAFNANSWRTSKPYLVRISYYDGRDPDTIVAWYPHVPHNGDILIHSLDGNCETYQVPVFWSAFSRSKEHDRLFLGVHTVRTLKKNEQPQKNG